MKDTLVTAIYYYSYDSRMGGRNYTFEHYENPFRNLLSLGMNIIVFSHPHEIEKINSFFIRNGYRDYKVIEYDLNDYRFSNMIYNIKETHGIIDTHGLAPGVSFITNDRNTHLCLSKINFLKMGIMGGYFDSKNYYWIDGGLFHNGLFPESLGGGERCLRPNEEKFWPKNKNNLCRPGIIERLNDKNNNQRLLFIGLTSFSAPRWWDKISETKKQIHIVGGLFGGDRDEVLKLQPRFEELVQRVLALNELTLEEDILSLLVAENKHQYLKFDTWCHDIPTDSCYYGVSRDAESFYKLFLDQ